MDDSRYTMWDMSSTEDDTLPAQPSESLASYHRVDESAADRAILTAFILTLVGFKLVTSVMVLYFFPSRHALILVLALSSMWIIAGAMYFGAITRVKVRLLRGRARRRKLLHEEWNVD